MSKHPIYLEPSSFFYPDLDTILLASNTHSKSIIPWGLALLRPVEPLEVDTHVEHCTPSQCKKPRGSPRSTVARAALGPI